MPFSYEVIVATLGKAAGEAEDNLMEVLSQMGGKKEASTEDMMRFQHAMQKWGLAHQTASTMVQEMGNTMKGIVQKAS